jgi:hypothetical protein
LQKYKHKVVFPYKKNSIAKGWISMAEKESWEKQETWDKYVDTGGEYKFDEEMLKRAFEEARKVYKERGFQRRMGYGKAPAVTTVDMARAWMSDGHPFTCENNEEICANAHKSRPTLLAHQAVESLNSIPVVSSEQPG